MRLNVLESGNAGLKGRMLSRELPGMVKPQSTGRGGRIIRSVCFEGVVGVRIVGRGRLRPESRPLIGMDQDHREGRDESTCDVFVKSSFV